jgi:hypothetical protein
MGMAPKFQKSKTQKAAILNVYLFIIGFTFNASYFVLMVYDNLLIVFLNFTPIKENEFEGYLEIYTRYISLRFFNFLVFISFNNLPRAQKRSGRKV